MARDKKKRGDHGTAENPADLAKDVAASVDDETVEAVDDDLKNDRRKNAKKRDLSNVALEDAFDAADMVSEGGPVDDPVEPEDNGD